MTTRRSLLALALLLCPSAARAHVSLRASAPAAGARLSASPGQLVLWFTARPQLAFSWLKLQGPAGAVSLGALAADSGNAIRASIPGTLTPGVYRVSWQAASADGHPMNGEFSFIVLGSIGDTSSVSAAATRSAATPAPHLENRGARWLEYVALLTILGALGFRHGVLPPLASRGVPTTDASDRAARFAQATLLLYVIAVAVRLQNESGAVYGEQSALDPRNLRSILTGTVWGVGWLLGLIGALLLFVARLIGRRSGAIATPIELTGALGMSLSPALSGHASAADHFVLSVTADTVHVAAASVWLGGLLMVVLAGIPSMKRLSDGNPHAAVSALVSSFHPIALFCAPIVVVAGTCSSWLRLGSIPALTNTEYGKMLLIKLGLFAAVVAVATYNALRARRRLGNEAGTRHLRRTAILEIVIAAMVIWQTTALVTTPVPSELVQ